MRALRALAIASAIGAWVVIVVGGVTTATGSGLGCAGVVDCGATPLGPGAAAIEMTHRIVAWVEGFLVLGMLVLVLRRYREWRTVRNLTILAFVLIVAQASLGIASVASGYGAFGPVPGLYEALVTTHLAVATGFLAVTVLNAAAVHRGPPPVLGGGDTPPDATGRIRTELS